MGLGDSMTLVDFILNSKKLKKGDFKEETQRGYQLRAKPKKTTSKKTADERLREVFLITQGLANNKKENGSRAVSKETEIAFATVRRYLDELRDKGYIKKIKRNRYAIVREYL